MTARSGRFARLFLTASATAGLRLGPVAATTTSLPASRFDLNGVGPGFAAAFVKRGRRGAVAGFGGIAAGGRFAAGVAGFGGGV